ncbi:MAG: hypothetical protein CVV44_21720 [Spirochaetae bacterium HGW-Spirochaetae-1]|nr:MAG: hypothetical protein CVV44_21720 [Spirochaetae bacterium HGW-Spirochaetae-1]
MKIAITTVGSTGDVEPFIPLARELLREGHEVKVISGHIYRHLFESRGIPFHAAGDPLDLDKIRSLMERTRHMNRIRQYRHIVNEVILADGEKRYHDCVQASRGADFAVCHTFDVTGQHAVTANNLPWASVILCPGMIPTKYHGPMDIPDMGTVVNSLLWKVAQKSMAPLDRHVSSFLCGLDGRKRKSSVFGNYSPDLNFIAGSRYLGKVYPDLPASFIPTGPWLREGESPVIDENLEHFIRTRKPEAAFTFGSMGGEDGDIVAKIFLEAIADTGISAVIQRGWGMIEAASCPDNVHFVDYVPHDYLFKNVRMVVHHGGAGTSYAACRAGVPSLVVHHIADQKYYGRVLEDIGVAPRSMDRKKFSSRLLAAGIRRILNDSGMAVRARALGETMHAENNGAAIAAEIINARLSNNRFLFHHEKPDNEISLSRGL